MHIRMSPERGRLALSLHSHSIRTFVQTALLQEAAAAAVLTRYCNSQNLV